MQEMKRQPKLERMGSALRHSPWETALTLAARRAAAARLELPGNWNVHICKSSFLFQVIRKVKNYQRIH